MAYNNSQSQYDIEEKSSSERSLQAKFGRDVLSEEQHCAALEMTLRLRIDEFRSRESRGPLPVPAGAGYPARLPEPRQASIDRPGGTGSLSGAYDEHRLHQSQQPRRSYEDYDPRYPTTVSQPRRSPPRRSPPRRWAEEPPQSRGYTAPAPPPPMLRDSSEFQTIVSASTNRPDQIYKASEQKKLEERQNIPLEDIGFREKLNYLNKNEGYGNYPEGFPSGHSGYGYGGQASINPVSTPVATQPATPITGYPTSAAQSAAQSAARPAQPGSYPGYPTSSQAMGEITPHHIQQLQQPPPQMHAQTQQQNQYMWPQQAPQNSEPPQINSSGGGPLHSAFQQQPQQQPPIDNTTIVDDRRGHEDDIQIIYDRGDRGGLDGSRGSDGCRDGGGRGGRGSRSPQGDRKRRRSHGSRWDSSPIKVQKSESKGPRKPSHCLYIRNIAEGTTNEQLKTVFEKYGVGVIEADVIKNHGFVHINANYGQERVNELVQRINGHKINGSNIGVQISRSQNGVRQKPGMSGDPCYREQEVESEREKRWEREKKELPPIKKAHLTDDSNDRSGGGSSQSFGDDFGPKKPRFSSFENSGKDDSLIKVEPTLIDKKFNFFNLPKSARILLVSNVPPEIAKPKPLFHLFSFYGDVVRVKILPHKTPDVALVEFETATQACIARNHLDQVQMKDHKLVVSFSRFDKIRASPGDEDLMEDFTGSDFDILRRFSKKKNEKKNLKKKITNLQRICGPRNCLHINNIPLGVNPDQVKALFESKGVPVQDMIAIRKKREGLKSVASAVIFIEVANNSDALIAMALIGGAFASKDVPAGLRVSFTEDNIREERKKVEENKETEASKYTFYFGL